MNNTQNISLATRVFLGLSGVAAFTYFFVSASAGGPLGSLVYVPLLATYPVISATRGWDPLKAGLVSLYEYLRNRVGSSSVATITVK